MRESFQRGGFGAEDTDYLWIDNSAANDAEAYEAYNRFLLAARTPYIVLCHQDVLLLDDGRAKLDSLIAGLHARDPLWGLAGNSGGRPDGRMATRITDPHGGDQSCGGPFPVRVRTLDENFIVARRDANLAVSRDLHGFHLYGTDLCLVAAHLGFSSWVIDFHLRHKSGGTIDATYAAARRALILKYRRAWRSRWMQPSTLQTFFLSGSGAASLRARGVRKLARLLKLRRPGA